MEWQIWNNKKFYHDILFDVRFIGIYIKYKTKHNIPVINAEDQILYNIPSIPSLKYLFHTAPDIQYTQYHDTESILLGLLVLISHQFFELNFFLAEGSVLLKFSLLTLSHLC